MKPVVRRTVHLVYVTSMLASSLLSLNAHTTVDDFPLKFVKP